MRKILAVTLSAMILGGAGIAYAASTTTNTTQGNANAYTSGCGRYMGSGMGRNVNTSQTYIDLMNKMRDNRQELYTLSQKYTDAKALSESAEFKKLQSEFLTVQKALIDERVKLGNLTKEQGEQAKAAVEKNIAACDGTQIGTGRGNCRGESCGVGGMMRGRRWN